MSYEGNNAAFTCEHCHGVFIVSAMVHPKPGGKQGREGQRKCPRCEKSVGNVDGGKNSDGKAWLDY
jgi:hypothetical protein